VVAEVAIHDADAFAMDYAPKVAGTLQPYGGQFLTSGKLIAVEGNVPQRFVIIAFDSVEKARGWYDSSAINSLCQFDRRRQHRPCSSPKAARDSSALLQPRIGCNTARPAGWEAGMKNMMLATIIATAAALGPSQAQQTTTKDQRIGSWKVLNLKAAAGDKVTYPLGEQVAGYVTITPTRFWLLFVDATRKAPAAPALTDA
jgi:uncharacterized protein (DUF1330 family)